MPTAKHKDGDIVYAKWPGSDLYYKAFVENFNPIANHYRVKFLTEKEGDVDENVFDIPSKYCLNENYLQPKSPSRRKSSSPSRQRKRSKSPSRSPSRRLNSSDQSPKNMQKTSTPRSRSPTRSILRSKFIESSTIANVQITKLSNKKGISDETDNFNLLDSKVTIPDIKAADSSTQFEDAESFGDTAKKTTSLLKKNKQTTQLNDEMIITRRITRSSNQKTEEVDSPKQIKSNEECVHLKTICYSVQFFKNLLSLTGYVALLFLTLFVLFMLFLNCKGKKKCELIRMPTLRPEKFVLNTFINVKSLTYVFGWFFFQAIILSAPIGKLAFGPPVNEGVKRITYRLNGLWALFTSLSLFVGLFFLNKWPLQLITIHYLSMISAAFLFSLVVGFFVFCHSYFEEKNLPSGGIIKDFMCGKVVSPLFLGQIDLRAFMLKAGLISWAIIDVWYFAKQWEQGRFSNTSLLMVLSMQLIYILDAMVFEESLYYSATLSQEKCGLLESTLFLVIVPFLNSSQLRYLSLFPVSLAWYCYLPIIVIFAVGYYIFRISTLQKFHFRRDPQYAAISGLDYISTGTGKDLLADGWWDCLRHPNYFGDFLVCIAFSAPCGFKHFLPWVWPTSLIFIFIYSAIKEEKKCLVKHGLAWKQYCERVKYRIFPYIW